MKYAGEWKVTPCGADTFLQSLPNAAETRKQTDVLPGCAMNFAECRPVFVRMVSHRVHMQLDAIDQKILAELQRDARLTNVELAARVNLSPSPCLTRVRALERHGVIRQRVTLLDPASLGLNVNVFIHLSLENQRRDGLDEFERAVVAIPNVMECYLMSGDADYLLRVLVRDTQALERLIIDEISRLPNIRNIRSSFALKQVMYSTALPVSNHQSF